MPDEQSTHYFWHNNGFQHIAPLQIHFSLNAALL